jgi:hypothetical protein
MYKDPVIATPAPPNFGIATSAELEKAKKSQKLLLQYVPGAPSTPAAQKLVDLFNEKYEGKDLSSSPEKLKAKVDAFKQLQANMVPLMSEEQKASAAVAQTAQTKAEAAKIAKAKAEAEKIAKLDTLPEEEQREYWLKKATSGDNYLSMGKNTLKYNTALQQAGITPAEIGFIKAFTGPHSHINESLREGHDISDEVLAFKHIMNDALAKMPKFTGDTVWRKINLTPEQQAKYVVGKISEWKAFNSTSKSNKVWSGNTIFTIRNPQTGVDVQSISENPSEAEVIMPANTFYRVLSNNLGSSGYREIEMEEVVPFGKKKKVA